MRFQQAKKDHFTGGNAALIGQHLVETANGNPRTVRPVSGVGPKLKELLHPNIDVPAESMVEEDEVHLILEYALGETWGEYTAPRANRFIFSYDRTNAELKPLDNFATALEGFDATNVVLSGVHMLEVSAEELNRVADGWKGAAPSPTFHRAGCKLQSERARKQERERERERENVFMCVCVCVWCVRVCVRVFANNSAQLRTCFITLCGLEG